MSKKIHLNEVIHWWFGNMTIWWWWHSWIIFLVLLMQIPSFFRISQLFKQTRLHLPADDHHIFSFQAQRLLSSFSLSSFLIIRWRKERSQHIFTWPVFYPNKQRADLAWVRDHNLSKNSCRASAVSLDILAIFFKTP